MKHYVTCQVSHSVDCGGGHFFCWECSEEAHAPVMCGMWKLWLVRCRSQGNEIAAESLHWLSTHTRDCPNCQVAGQPQPLNHMLLV